MRLLHVARSLDPKHGGPSESVRMFVLAHQRAGNEVEVATLDAPGTFETAVNCEVHACGPGKLTYGYSSRLLDWLRANKSRFDGVIVNGVWQYHGVAARKAFAGKRPYVVFAHGMLDPYFRDRYPLKHLKKLLYWNLEEARNLNRAEAVCFTSEEEKKIAANGFPFRNFRRVVVPYGTTGPEGEHSMLRGAFAESFPALADLPFLLFLGRIHPKKGCDLLIEAFARTAPEKMHLVIAGPDETGWRSELEPLADRLGISARVHWTGMISGQLKWGALLMAQAFILPSHQENFGIAVADALACGVIPLISTQVNIAPDVTADGAGIIEPDTLDGTDNLIRRFLSLTPDERTQMSVRGLECYRRRYALSGAAETLYQALGIGPEVPKEVF